MEEPMPLGQLWLSIGVLAMGVAVLAGSYFIPDAGGYSTVGPALVPRAVGAVLILLGGFLVYEVLWLKGYRNHDEEGERALPMNWQAFAWVSAGIILYGVVIEHIGFVLASVVLYVCTAAGFGNRRWVINAITALILAAGIFALFNYGLGLNLPKGFLKGVLP
jgi:putative tricarboxylic transport membrane protein